MLCDLLLGKWFDPARKPKFEPEVEELIKHGKECNEEAIRRTTVSKERMEEVARELKNYLDNGLHLGEDGIAFSELPTFQAKLRESQKFFVSPEFAKTSLMRFATPETLVKAKEWFRLIHDPMWLEWHYEEVPDLRIGALFYSRLAATGETTYWCYLVDGVIKGPLESKLFSVYHYRLMPETARVEDGVFLMDIDADEDMAVDKNDVSRKLACHAYDFIIRINSPRITEFRPGEDLTKLNKKRLRLGRAPLCTYQIVDLNRTIKAQLRQSDSEGDSGVRFHWRRGHFKARKTGLFWWSPHTAGRKAYGEVEKEYVA